MGTTSTYTLTRTELVDMALRRLGNHTPTATERAQAVMALGLIIKRLDVSGRWLWCVNHTPSSLTTVALQASYATGATASTINTNILELEKAWWMQAADNSIELEIYDKTAALGSIYRDDSGQPVALYLETAPVLANQKLWVYPKPDAAYSIQYNFRRRLYDFTAAGDNPDMPGEWVDVLKKELALDLAPEYGLPPTLTNELRLEVMEARRLIVASNAEDAPTTTLTTLYY